jgi:hypothetical protein
MPTLSHCGFGIFGGKILSHFWHVVNKNNIVVKKRIKLKMKNV